MKVRNVLFMAALALAPLRAEAGEDSVEAKFYRGYYLETALRDFDGALAAYDEAEKLATGDAAKFLVPTLVAKARCLQSKGKIDEAKALLTRVLEIEPNHAEARNLLERGDDTTKADPELEQRLSELIRKLGTGEREQASNDLEAIGAVKYPFLESGLRSRDIGVVSRCSYLLAKDGSAMALSILEEAMRSPDVVFPAQLMAGFTYGSGARRFELCEVALTSKDEELRKAAVSRGIELSGMSNPAWSVDVDRTAAFVEQACDDLSPRVLAGLVSFGKWNRKVLERVTPRLLSIVTRLDPDSRRHFARSINELSVPINAMDEWLTSSAGDPDPEIRSSSLLLVYGRYESNAISADAALERALASLDDPSRTVISRGLDLLNRIASKREVQDPSRITDAAVRALERWDQTQLELAGNLVSIVGQAIDADADRFDRLWQATLLALPRCKDEAKRSALVGFFQAVTQRFGKVPGMEFISSRLLLIESEAQQIQVVRAVRSQGSFGGEAESHFINAVALSPHRPVRFELYESDYSIADIRLSSETALRNVASDLPRVSVNARKRLQALVRSNPSAIFLEPARQYFEQSTGGERKGALSTYIACAGAEAVPLLRKIIEANPMDRDSAYPLLISRLGVDGVGDFIAWYRTSLIELLASPNSPGPVSVESLAIVESQDRREFAKRLMESLPVAEWTPELVRGIKSYCGGVEPRLIELGLSSTDPAVIYPTLVIAAEWMPESCEPLIVPFLDSSDPSLVRAAQQALAAIRERRELRSATKLSLSFDRTKATEEARDFLKSDDPIKRRGGALALGALGDVSAIPLLLKLLDDKVPEVREAALSALSKLDSSAASANSAKPPPQKDG